MVLGLRVVRGPDWEQGNQDGGRDHLGTVTAFREDSTVVVLWDMGKTTTCRVGKDGKHDVRVFDNAPIGVFHPKFGCSACHERLIIGTRWQCNECKQVNLCSPCYYDDEHDVTHGFCRYDTPGCVPTEVKKRSESKKTKAQGIFPSAKVTRGRDWDFGNQDGGPKKVGTVEDVVNFGQDIGDRNAVKVKWPSGQTEIYRLGFKGKVDVKCNKESMGASLYIEHLANIDLVALDPWCDKSVVLNTGDRVCIVVSKNQLRKLQQGRQLAWTSAVEGVIGEIGSIHRFTKEDDVEVKYNKEVVTLAKEAIQKVPELAKGDKVYLTDSIEQLKRLQSKQGGWDDGMTQVLGKRGEVTAVDTEGDCAVMFEEGVTFVFHPCSLVLIHKSKGAAADDGEDEEGERGEEMPPAEGGIDVSTAAGSLSGLDSFVEQEDEPTERQFFRAIVKSKEADFKILLEQQPELVNCHHDNISCLCIAAFIGNVSIITALIEAGADLNSVDGKANNPLLIAIQAGHADAARVLIEKGAKLNRVNLRRQSALHCAAEKNMADIIELLIEKGHDLNLQDIDGNTALHDAISEHHDAAASVLIRHKKLDIWVKNKVPLTCLAHACLKGHFLAVEKLVQRDRKLVDAPGPEEFRPLHVACTNNHLEEAKYLITKGKADVNVQNEKNLTPLHLASSEAYFTIVELLISYGADWKMVDSSGNTPLHLCLRDRRTEGELLQVLGVRNKVEDVERIKVAAFLIEKGASIEAENSDKETPLAICSCDAIRDEVEKHIENIKKNGTEAAARPKIRQGQPRRAIERGTSNARRGTGQQKAADNNSKENGELDSNIEQQESETAAGTENEIVDDETPTSSTGYKFFAAVRPPDCLRCLVNTATVRYLPCEDLVTCVKCCYKFKKCPQCEQNITGRVDRQNKPLPGEDKCIIS